MSAMSLLDTHYSTPAVSVAAGITVGLIASLVQSLGLTIQRKSHVLEESLPDDRRRPEHRRPLWLLGFAVFICSNVLGSVFQIAALPVVILAPLGAVSLLWNAVFARLLLGDVFTSLMAAGTVLIAAGAVLIAVFGVVQEPNHSVEELLALLRRPPFVVYFSLLTLAVVVAIFTTHIAESTLPTIVVSESLEPLESPTAQASEHTPLLPPRIDTKAARGSPPPSSSTDAALQRKRTLIAVSFASLSGILSGMCIIFAKAGVELLLLSIGGKNQFWRWESWVLLSALVVTALLQLWYLHKSLVLAAPTLVCPLAFCFYNISSILNGLIYFDQFSQLGTGHIALVIVGIFVLLSGVGALSAREHGIELGTWFEGGDALDAAIISDDMEGVPRADVTVTTPGPADPRAMRFSNSPPILSTRRAATSVASPEDEDEPPAAHMSMSETLPRRPSAHGRMPSAPLLGMHGRRRSGMFLEPPTAGAQNATSFGAGGLSIGLSPISPGFALVPRRRVSAVGAKGLGFASVVRAAMGSGRRALTDFTSQSAAADSGAAAEPAARTQSGWQWQWLRDRMHLLSGAPSDQPPPSSIA
ncbi:hypothetical protein BKA62DRAFT_505846 [Auriculariales sp. MPI-PUGE-AT-0066]|nr:hypothetical protein BKA62DRAFT_505846 [Auriculariales sp. MPI-PUGE-AT-0066]